MWCHRSKRFGEIYTDECFLQQSGGQHTKHHRKYNIRAPLQTPDEIMCEYCSAVWQEQINLYSSFFESHEQGLHFIFNELAYFNTTHLDVELNADTEYVL